MLRVSGYYTVAEYVNKEEFDYFIRSGFLSFLEQVYSNKRFHGEALPLYSQQMTLFLFAIINL